MSRTKKNINITKKIKTQNLISKKLILKKQKSIIKKITNKKQYGGNVFTHWINMLKFNKLIKDLQKEEKNISKYIDSYKINAKNFKNIAEDKSNKSTDYILNKRQLIIINFSKPKDDNINSVKLNNKNYLKTVINAHDLEMINNKEQKLNLELLETEKSISKNLPEFLKDKKKLEKESRKFRELVTKISTGDLGKFQAKIKLLKKEYDEILPRAKGTLKSIHKKALKKYLSHKSDYEKVIKLDDTYIQKQQSLVHEINNLLEESDFYIQQMEILENKREDSDINIVKWETIYTSIYEIIQKILKNIKNTKEKIEEIKKLETQIDIAIHPIAQTTTDINIKQSSTQIKNSRQDFESIIKYLDASAAHINQILDMLLNEKMASELYLDVTKIATAFESAEKAIEKNKNIFIKIQDGGGVAGLKIHNIKEKDFNKVLTRYETFGIDTNKMLFIYTDHFNEYSNGLMDYHKSTTDSSKYRQYRIDTTNSLPHNKMITLGIPIDSRPIPNKIANIISDTTYVYNDTDDLKTIDLVNDVKDNTNENYNNLFEKSLKNIYAYIVKNNITNIFYITRVANELSLSSFNELWTKNNLHNINKQFSGLIDALKTKGFDFVSEANEELLLKSINPSPDQIKIDKVPINLKFSEIDKDGFILQNGIKLKIDNKSFIGDEQKIVDLSKGDRIEIKGGKVAIVDNQGYIYIDPSNSKNSPFRTIIKSFQEINKDKNQYDNNIKIIEESTKKINEILDNMMKKESDFMSITVLVQDLSQKLLDLKYIEPKVIKITLDKPKPIAKQYSWILNPVEINKTEFHALAGTDTLDKLIRENKEMQDSWKTKSYVTDNEIGKIIDILSISKDIRLSNDQETNLYKIDINTIIEKCLEKIRNSDEKDKEYYSCNLYSNLRNKLGSRMDNYKDKLPCKDKNKQYNNKGRGRGRGQSSYGRGGGINNINGMNSMNGMNGMNGMNSIRVSGHGGIGIY